MIPHAFRTALPLALVAAALASPARADPTESPIEIGTRLELFVDDHLIERLSGGARRVLHHPTPRELAVVHDRPWEGNACAYYTVFRDENRYRMYYRGLRVSVEDGKSTTPHREVTCYAESPDGIEWAKPELGLFEFDGSKANNIVWDGPGTHNFAPFKDANPECASDARYKALCRGEGRHLLAMRSADGIRWSPMREEPVITRGAFDSQNLAFWDGERQEYRAYFRDFRDGKRDIKTCVSKDFLEWSEPEWLEYPGAEPEHLYTNQVAPYPRAPHIFIGLPTRYIDRGWSGSMRELPELEDREARAAARRRYGTALTEGLLMSSRDGRTFERWAEAFLRPGPERPHTWAYGDSYIAWHAVATRSALEGSPDELSIYAAEGYWTEAPGRLRRYTLRMDGFVSVRAPVSGGELLTRPLVFEGERLAINFSTSAAGSVRVEIQEADGSPVEGYTLADCEDTFGDSIDRAVRWKSGEGVGPLAGSPVRLRFRLEDADLYAFRFR